MNVFRFSGTGHWQPVFLGVAGYVSFDDFETSLMVLSEFLTAHWPARGSYYNHWITLLDRCVKKYAYYSQSTRCIILAREGCDRAGSPCR